MSWTRYLDENGLPEQVGLDGGAIIADEEHGLGARITLEQNTGFAEATMTCGIYGWMMHTRYFPTLAAARADYDAMKIELVTILEMIPMRDDPEVDAKSARASDAMSAFVDRYP